MRKKILISVDWFPPAYKAGGPVRSVYNLAAELAEKHEVYIYTSAYEMDGTALTLTPDLWQKHGNLRVFYASRSSFSRWKAILKETDPEIVYLNGIFSFGYSIIPVLWLCLAGKKYRLIISPRGMLLRNALRIKPLKKKIFLLATLLIKMYNKVDAWIVSSEEEKNDLIKIFPFATISVYVIPNIPTLFDSKVTFSKEKGQLTILYYARILPNKQLLYLLNLIEELAMPGIELRIVGPVEDESYWNECNKVINKLQSKNIEVTYNGAIHLNDLPEVARGSHLGVLPTTTENYGHSILEVMSLGIPMLLSDKTPWNDITAFQAGKAIDLRNKEDWKEALRVFYYMDYKQWNSYSDHARQYVREKINRKEILSRYESVF